jgi:hypothetical protein
MAEGRFVAYFRVSTAQQGRSGLGLEAQRQAVLSFLNGGAWALSAEYTVFRSGPDADQHSKPLIELGSQGSPDGRAMC